MQKSLSLVLAATGLLSGSAFAQEAGFNNFLLNSPSIISPSQNYQVKQGRFEGYLGAITGSSDSKIEGQGDTDNSGVNLGLGAYYAVNPMAVIGIDVDYEGKKDDDLKSHATSITPSVAFSVTPMFSLGLAVNLVNGSKDLPTPPGGDVNTDYNFFSIGATLHEDLWEATLVYNTENQEDNKPQNDSAAGFGLHGRYKFMPNLALGLSLAQKDTSALAPADKDFKDEMTYGIHLETAFTPEFGMEFAFLSTADAGGAEGDDSSEFVAMGQYRVTPSLEVGGRLSYITESTHSADVSGINPGVFLTSYF